MLRLTIAAASTLLLGACVHTENDNPALGGRVALPALSTQAATEPVWAEGPSLTGIERTNWGSTEVFVPVSGIAHGPLYTRNIYRAKATRRQRGEYPTPLSALDLVEGTTARQRGEALLAPVTSIGQILLMIPRAFCHPPWSTDFSPLEHYERYWHPQGPDPETLKDEG